MRRSLSRGVARGGPVVAAGQLVRRGHRRLRRSPDGRGLHRRLHLGSEGEVAGREAILAWRVSAGTRSTATSLDGLAVVAVVAGDRNLGTHETRRRRRRRRSAVLMVDQRATAAQREALVAMARALAPTLRARRRRRASGPDLVHARRRRTSRSRAGEATLDVTTKFEHSPTCGAIQWFDPLATTTQVGAGALARPKPGRARRSARSGRRATSASSFVGTSTEIDDVGAAREPPSAASQAFRSLASRLLLSSGSDTGSSRAKHSDAVPAELAAPDCRR